MTAAAPKTKLAAPRRSFGPGRIGVEIIAALFIVFLTVPWQPSTEAKIGPQEYSWMLLMHHAIATGMQFGPQIIMPEGPLAFLGNDAYDPRTYPILILARMVIALVSFWSLAELGRRFFRTEIAALPWLLAVIALMGVSPDCFFPDCVILLLLNYFLVKQRKLSPSSIAMLVVLGAASLIKTNQLLYAVIGVGVLSIDQLAQRSRRFYLPIAIYLGSLAIFYLAARQSPTSIGSFIWGWWQVLTGHANAAALTGPRWDPLFFLLLAVAAIALVAWSQWKVSRWVATCIGSALIPLLFLLYKHSFVRQDEYHVMIAPTTLLTLLIIYLPILWRVRAAPLRIAGLLATALNVALIIWILWFCTVDFERIYVFGEFQHFDDNIAAAAEHFTDPDRLTRAYESTQESDRGFARLPRDKIIGTVDVYPHWQVAIFAYGLPYAPRPVPVSFVANTPVLSSLNARHLASPDAAQTILFDIAPVDEKYPTTLDGASIPELLSRYDLVDDSGGMLILRRAPVPRTYSFTPLSVQQGQLDQPIVVPSVPGGMVWARIHFHKRATSALVSAIYKPATLAITVITARGRQMWRLLPDLAEQGFLLSPLIDNRELMADLYRDPQSKTLARNVVKSMTIAVYDASLDGGFDSDFTVTFERLKLSHNN